MASGAKNGRKFSKREENSVGKVEIANKINSVYHTTKSYIGLSLPSDKILGLAKLKAFAKDILKVALIMISVSDKVANIARNGENASYQHFLLFNNDLKSV